jgi:hypothetical protein
MPRLTKKDITASNDIAATGLLQRFNFLKSTSAPLASPLSRALLGLVLIAFLFDPNSRAFAKITITSIDPNRVSAVEGLGTTTVKIFGGFAGTCATTSSTIYCNSCASITGSGDAALTSCNLKRSHAALEIVVGFNSDAVSGIPTVIPVTSAGVSGAALTLVSTSGTTAKGATATATFLWSGVCAGLDSTIGTACPSDSISGVQGFTGSLKIGLDADSNGLLSDTGDDSTSVSVVGQGRLVDNSDLSLASVCTSSPQADDLGICQFETKPGDSKITIKNLNAISGFPLLGTIKTQAVGVRVFYIESLSSTFDTSNFANITPSTAKIKDLSFTGTADKLKLTASTVTGLKNSAPSEGAPVSYYFKTAIIDQAQNVGFYTATSAAGQALDTDCAGTDNPTGNTCHFAQPGEVVGILTENTKCFVATAAWGSPFQPKVVDLRKFRDQFLLTHAVGKKFVNWYYYHSPDWARKISNHETLRAAARIMLWPAWAFASLALDYGINSAMIISLLLITGLIYIISSFLRARRAQNLSRALRQGRPSSSSPILTASERGRS